MEGMQRKEEEAKEKQKQSLARPLVSQSELSQPESLVSESVRTLEQAVTHLSSQVGDLRDRDDEIALANQKNAEDARALLSRVEESETRADSLRLRQEVRLLELGQNVAALATNEKRAREQSTRLVSECVRRLRGCESETEERAKEIHALVQVLHWVEEERNADIRRNQAESARVRAHLSSVKRTVYASLFAMVVVVLGVCAWVIVGPRGF